MCRSRSSVPKLYGRKLRRRCIDRRLCGPAKAPHDNHRPCSSRTAVVFGPFRPSIRLAGRHRARVAALCIRPPRVVARSGNFREWLGVGHCCGVVKTHHFFIQCRQMPHQLRRHPPPRRDPWIVDIMLRGPGRPTRGLMPLFTLGIHGPNARAYMCAIVWA